MSGQNTASLRRAPAMLFAAVALLAVAACGRHHDDDDKAVTITAGDGSGETSTVELKLPGGFEAKVKGPARMGEHSHVDIDGVGLYPGAKLGGVQVKVDASDEKGHEANVDLSFSAKSDPAAVADWYQQQFEAKGVTATRTGNALSGKSKDGDDFTVTAAANKDGGTAGTIAIRDSK